MVRSRPSTRMRPNLVSFALISVGPAPVGPVEGDVSGAPDGGGGATVEGDAATGGDSEADEDGWAYPPEAGPARCRPPQPEVSRPALEASAQAVLSPSRMLSAPSRGAGPAMGRSIGCGACPFWHGRHRRFPGSVVTSSRSSRPWSRR